MTVDDAPAAVAGRPKPEEAAVSPGSHAVGPGLAEAFAALDQADVTWCLLRRTADLVDPRGDVDLLVAESDATTADAVLLRLGYAVLPFGPPAGAGYLRHDAATDRWLWLDVATRLVFGPGDWRTGGEREVLGGRRREGSTWVPDPGDEFWLLVLHLLAGGRSAGERHRGRLLATVGEAAISSSLAVRLAVVLPPGSNPERIVEIVRRQAWEELEALGRQVLARAGRGGGRPRAALATAGRSLRLLVEALVQPRAFRRRMGLGVALLGPDGAGKSSTGRALVEHFPFEGRQVYMGMRGGVTSPDPGGAHIPGVSALLGVAIQWGAWLIGFAHMARGRLVVFDRYTEDAFLPPPSDETAPKRLGRRIRTWMACPPPDLTIVLDAPGEMMFRRKGEHSPERLERQRQRYLGLRGRLPHVVIVDATQRPDEVRRAATRHLWRRYACRLASGRQLGAARRAQQTRDVYSIDMGRPARGDKSAPFPTVG
jgi:thymidylate kinase